jgi:acetyl esterase/lipase
MAGAQSPHPAQIEDVAAAFAWTFRHVGEFNGDTNRIYVAGHSAGGHLAALLSLDDRQLAPYHLAQNYPGCACFERCLQPDYR